MPVQGSFWQIAGFPAPDHQPASCEIAALADKLGITALECMRLLLRHDIWPLRFARNRGAISENTMLRLLSTRFFIAGCGGLGGHVASLLARTGAGYLRLCDPDVFTESNLNRQLFCTEKNLGEPKVKVLQGNLMDIASYLMVECHQTWATAENLPGLLAGIDVAMDCLDSVDAKKTLELACRNARVAYLHGSVLHGEGLIYLDMPAGERLTALYPENPPAPDSSGVNVLPCAVAATGAIMVSLLINAFENGPARSPLLHLDCMVPELETFPI